MSTLAYLGVGSNLGNREVMIETAKRLLSADPKIRLLRSAPIYETDPVGGPVQGPYLNTVWELETDLNAQGLMALLLETEEKLGRKRFARQTTRRGPSTKRCSDGSRHALWRKKNGPRVIDLDLLFFGDEVIDEPGLEVPHPRLQDRWFVLKPLWDLRSDLVHPVLKKSVCELLTEVDASHKKSQKT